MSVLHVLHVPTRVVSQRADGERWCFVCRKQRAFTFTVHQPTDPESYYGPHATIECGTCGNENGDLFPGRIREWES